MSSGPERKASRLRPGRPRRERVVAGVDEVRADLEARRAQAARGERSEQAGRDRRLAGARARAADDDPRDHAAASRRAAPCSGQRRRPHRRARRRRLGHAVGPGGRDRATPAQRGDRAGVVRAVMRVRAVVGADGERPAGARDGVAERRRATRRRAPRAPRPWRRRRGGAPASSGAPTWTTTRRRAALDRVDRGTGLGVQVGVDVAGRAGRDDERARPAGGRSRRPRRGAATTTVVSSSARGRRAPSAQTRTPAPPAGARPLRRRRATRRWPCVHAPPSAAATMRAMPARAREPSSRRTSARHGAMSFGTGTP